MQDSLGLLQCLSRCNLVPGKRSFFDPHAKLISHEGVRPSGFADMSTSAVLVAAYDGLIAICRSGEAAAGMAASTTRLEIDTMLTDAAAERGER